MKSKLIISSVFASILAMSALFAYSPAQAQWHHHGGYYRGGGYYSGGNWVAPLIIGGFAGAVIARETAPVIVQQPPVIIQQQPVYVNPEIRYIDGVAYRVQIMNINGVNQEVLVRQ
jgi:hypothetical protein